MTQQPPSKKAEDLLRELESIRALLQSAKSKQNVDSSAAAEDDDNVPMLEPDDDVPVLLNDDDDVPLLQADDEDDDIPVLAAADEPHITPNPHHDGMSLFDIANEGDDYPVFKTGAQQKPSVLGERVSPVRHDDYAPLLSDSDLGLGRALQEDDIPIISDARSPPSKPANPFLTRSTQQIDIEDITGSMARPVSLPGTNPEAMALFDKLRASSTTLEAIKDQPTPDAVRAATNMLIEHIISETMPKLETELRLRLRAQFLK